MAETFGIKGHPGIDFYESEKKTFKNKPDRCFYIRYTDVNGKRQRERIGWASDGFTVTDCTRIRAERIRETLLGHEAVPIRKRHKSSISLKTFFAEKYFPDAESEKASAHTEKILFTKWIDPALGEKPLHEISSLDVERLKKTMKDAGKSPRTIQYSLAVLRRIFNCALEWKTVQGQNPVAGVKAPKFDNRKMRFLSINEAERLLEAVKGKSPQLHAMALISLHCGLRFGELAALTWQDVDFVHGVLTLRDTKNARTRHAFLTSRTRQALKAMRPESPEPSDLVFPARTGGKQKQVSRTFIKTVNDLEFNKGVPDPRQKVTFHTLRHSFASWLAQQGESLFIIQKLLGHQTATMTQRYSHASPSGLRDAVKRLEAFQNEKKVSKLVNKK